MLNSGPGRHESAELRQRRPQARRAPEAEHRDVREPRAGLAPVHLEALEALVEVDRQPAGTALLVLEHEHADTARLAVAERPQHGRSSGCRPSGSARPRRSCQARAHLSEKDWLNWHDVRAGLTPYEKRAIRAAGAE